MAKKWPKNGQKVPKNGPKKIMKKNAFTGREKYPNNSKKWPKSGQKIAKSNNSVSNPLWIVNPERI